MEPLKILVAAILFIAELAVLVRAILRPHREPAARLAWVIFILIAPVIGPIIYLLLGETRLGRRRAGHEIDRHLPRPTVDDASVRLLQLGDHYAPFALARTVNDLAPAGGNTATLAAAGNGAIDAMVADIDAAARHVHLSTYIWLQDNNGLKVKDALICAAKRGIAVRALVDALGSRPFIRSQHWRDLVESGVQMKVALPIGNPIRVLTRGRLDLRNHRKSLVVDTAIAWCGSQNIADPEFRIKPRFAPWVDIMTRWVGPVARDCQFLFVSDWMGEGGGDISDCICEVTAELRPAAAGIIAQVIGTGPTLPFDAMPTCFAELIHSAREELVITTPYFVPDETLLYALVSAARRGVRTLLVFPKRNDSLIVAGASRSYYRDLIDSGARIFEYRPGLLHAKTMVVDRSVGLIGSANLDRRSFELNFENNILFADPGFAAEIRDRQDEYIAESDEVTADQVKGFSLGARFGQNFLAMLSPIL